MKKSAMMGQVLCAILLLGSALLASPALAQGGGTLRLVGIDAVSVAGCATVVVRYRNESTTHPVARGEAQLTVTLETGGPAPGTPVMVPTLVLPGASGTMTFSLCAGEAISNAQRVRLQFEARPGRTLNVTGLPRTLAIQDGMWREVPLTPNRGPMTPPAR